MSLSKLYVTLSLIAFAAVNLAQAQSTCSPDQRKQFFLTAVDKDGTVIEKLRAEYLSLKIGGAPATIADVVFRANSPLDLAVLIDASGSMEEVIPTAKAAARAFVAKVPVAGLDRVAVVSFSDKPNVLQPLTADFNALAPAIDQVRFDPPPGYVSGGVVVIARRPIPRAPLPGTSLWDVVAATTTELFEASPEKRRRVMLLFTDGSDTNSSSKLKVVIDEAIKNHVAVFAMGMGYTVYSSENDLKKLAEQTGGIAKIPGRKKEKLEAALNEVARHLRGNYLVGYCGGAAKDRAKIQLEVVDPEIRKAKPVLAYKRY